MRSIALFLLAFSLSILYVTFSTKSLAITDYGLLKYKYNESSYSTSTDDIFFEEEDFDNNIWPPLRHVLCGKGTPNLKLARTLFRLARMEVFDENDPTIVNRTFSNANGNGGPTRTLSTFFAGDWGASIIYGGHANNINPSNFTTLYVRIWKCGNDQIRSMERTLSTTLASKGNKQKLTGTYLSDITLWHGLDTSAYTSNNPKESSSDDSPIVPPCIYTVIRDPISHFLSGYNEAETRILGYDLKVFSGGMRKYAWAPYLTAVPYSNSSESLRRLRFSEYVKDLLREDETLSRHYMYSHSFSMSRILSILSRFNVTLTGYIPTLQNITSTWPNFISSTCPGAPSIDMIPQMGTKGQHKSSKDTTQLYKAAKDVWAEAGPIARSLCMIHAYDYACWENLPDGIPNLCKDVYEKYAEQIITYGSQNYYNYDDSATIIRSKTNPTCKKQTGSTGKATLCIRIKDI
jgi:hypothetical protein